jgi:acetyl esterase/lipase
MTAARIAEVRQCRARVFYGAPLYQEIRERYRVAIASEEIGGVPTEIFTPAAGVAPQNERRVLINLHGGGFRDGSRTISHFESIPIAAVARIKVVSVDYRMAPQYAFPAASEDVAAVYKELIQHYDPKKVGIYGCSAGGLLTAQSIAWLQKENLPLPGAVGMFCAGGSFWSKGDSGHFATLWEQRPASQLDDPYFDYLRNVDPNDSLAYPVRSKEVMARFPPSLLIASTRDLALSSVVYTHSVLVQQRVPAELHVWEGLPHSFFVDPELPQSREVYEIAARFFDRNLASSALTTSNDK